MKKVTILIHATDEFKDALGQYAHDKKMSASELIRQCVAEKIGYDLNKDGELVDGRRKYKDEEERKEAQRQKVMSDRRLRQQLADAFAKDERLAAAFNIEQSLLRRGVKVS